jgi:hypothetical protein
VKYGLARQRKVAETISERRITKPSGIIQTPPRGDTGN